jgi:hypothetical protein
MRFRGDMLGRLLPKIGRGQEAVGDAGSFEEGERAGLHARRHLQERDEIDGMVDIHGDARLTHHERLDAAASRRI